MLLGWMEPLTKSDRPAWIEVVAYGLLLGITASLSVVEAELLLLLVPITVLVRHPWSTRTLVAWGSRGFALVAVGLLFIVRSLIGIAVWWNYPAHVLTPSSGSQLQSAMSQNGSFVGLVDPFLFRPQDVWLSPFPILKVELALLLVVGILLLGVSAGFFGWPVRTYRLPEFFSASLLRHLTVGIIGCWVAIGVVELGVSGLLSVTIQAPFTNIDELSILLFVFYTAVATLPLVIATEYLVTHVDKELDHHVSTLPPPHRHSRDRTLPSTVILAVFVVACPLVSGAIDTAVQAPSYLGSIVNDLANVTSGDIAALDWAKVNLPPCSGVFVAPGSAGQFLPSYADVRLIFPMDPRPSNASYTSALDDLIGGNYTNVVKADLLELNVTEVFVTGQTNTLWKPILPAPLEESADFQVLFHDEDAYVLEFGPGLNATACLPG
jgi:hypothetical protein